MTLVFICLILYIFCRAFGTQNDPSVDEAKDKLISQFIIQYAATTGKVLTRRQAEDLIRITIEIEGPDLMRNWNRELEYKDARERAVRLCEAAERKMGRKIT